MNRQPFDEPNYRRSPERPYPYSQDASPYRIPIQEEPQSKEKQRLFRKKEPKEHHRHGFFRSYFMICGILVNIYGLIWLLIKLFTELGKALP